MKWAYHVKYKLKAAIFLTGIIVIILLSNLSERNSFSDLGNSMSSIYNDRLIPATYIFDITKSLYQKRLLSNNTTIAVDEWQRQLNKHNSNIDVLIRRYEETFLTKEEQEQWFAFKSHLYEYNRIESERQVENLHNIEKIDTEFNLTMQSLNSLSQIQVGEGNNLQRHSKSVVSNTVLLSYLETALLIILGLCVLILLSASDNTLFRQPQNQALN